MFHAWHISLTLDRWALIEERGLVTSMLPSTIPEQMDGPRARNILNRKPQIDHFDTKHSTDAENRFVCLTVEHLISAEALIRCCYGIGKCEVEEGSTWLVESGCEGIVAGMRARAPVKWKHLVLSQRSPGRRPDR